MNIDFYSCLNNIDRIKSILGGFGEAGETIGQSFVMFVLCMFFQ